MIYRRVTGKVCVARQFDRFNIDYADWTARAPLWINQALLKLGMYEALEIVNKPIAVINHTFILPCDIKSLVRIKYEGVVLDKYSAPNHKNATNRAEQNPIELGYDIDNNGKGYTSFEEGVIEVYYKRIPVEKDTQTGLYYPMVPDDEEVQEAIDYYLLTRILQRGHIHPVYSLESRNRYTNPAILWEESMKKARNSANALDWDSRMEISKMIRTFLVDYNKYNEDNFDNTGV